MKKYNWFIIGITIIIIFIGISLRKKDQHIFDERVTLNAKDKIPYGASAAIELLPSLFPQASIFIDYKSPGSWDSLSSTSYNQAVVLASINFNADDQELSKLIQFAQFGNYVFIIARSFSYSTLRAFGISYTENLFEDANRGNDSMKLHLSEKVFFSDNEFSYPGRKFESSFYSYDTSRTFILGTSSEGKPNFIGFKTGNGAIFIHGAPLAFSNFFLLHKNNYQYFENVFSVIPAKVNKLDWNEYYLSNNQKSKDPAWLRFLFRYPSLKWGLIIIFLFLMLFVILGIRREQRMIPTWQKPFNDSLDFVRTMGRLYYERKDHMNLAQKMITYFLEHVRTKYKIPTDDLNDAFIEKLFYKSNYPIPALTEIVLFINYIENETQLSEVKLGEFHNKLELFYQNT